LIIYSVMFCGAWVVLSVYVIWALRSLPMLKDVTDSFSCDQLDWPLVSIIIPACNEAQHIEAAIGSLLHQDYPALEIIAINDRSCDNTGDILDKLAKQDARLKVIHIQSLPERWLGKVHALHNGVQQASGDWYLFTDADINYQPDAVRKALCYTLYRDIDHLTCLPRVDIQPFWLNVAVRAFVFLFTIATRLLEVNISTSKRPIGLGAFNLVKRTTLDNTPGFGWLREEPVDDLGLGLMIQQAGGRSQLLNARHEMSVSWYPSLSAMIRGMEKNSFGPSTHYRWLPLIRTELVLWCLIAAPWLSFVVGIILLDSVLLSAALSAMVSMLMLLLAIPSPGNKFNNAVINLCLPAGIAIYASMMLRSAWLCMRNGGIDWRGTHYPVEELRKGQRVKF
jgi:cellulose synthase/poly-beta-1,6-N-acetylglucosamine synthase-like glycosyltransferase